MACKQQIRHDHKPKCVIADNGYVDEYPDKREPREDQREQEYEINEHVPLRQRREEPT